MRFVLLLTFFLLMVSCQTESENVIATPSPSLSSRTSDDFSNLKEVKDEACELKEEEIDTSKPFKLQGGDPGCDPKIKDE